MPILASTTHERACKADRSFRWLRLFLCAAVTLNGKKLAIHQETNELEVIPYVEKGEFLLLWQLHRAGLGNAVELTTGELP